MKTIVKLFFEAKLYANTGSGNVWEIFKTLFLLYFKSKFFDTSQKTGAHSIRSFKVHTYSYSILIHLYRDIFLKQIYKPSLSTNTPFIVDCGANIGISVLYFKYLYPEGEVWAFEPNPHSFYLLEKNIKENNIIGVKLYNCALGNMEEQIVFYVPINKSSLNGGSYISFEKGNIVHVQCQRLSQIVKGKKIDLIKIDIEGDETNVIEDLDQQHTLKYASEYVMEYHFKPTRTSKDFSDFITLFEKNGFVCELNYNEEIEINKQDILVRAKRRQYLR